MHDPTINPALLPPGVEPVQKPAQGGPAVPLKGPAFDEALRQRVGTVKFSGHALQRVERRGIDLDANNTLARLEAGADRAASEGARGSVGFVDGPAFVGSVRDNTAITPAASGHKKE